MKLQFANASNLDKDKILSSSKGWIKFFTEIEMLRGKKTEYNRKYDKTLREKDVLWTLYFFSIYSN